MSCWRGSLRPKLRVNLRGTLPRGPARPRLGACWLVRSGLIDVSVSSTRGRTRAVTKAVSASSLVPNLGLTDSARDEGMLLIVKASFPYGERS